MFDMKALILLQRQHSKIGQAVARTLKDTHGVTDFCAYVFSPDTERWIAEEQNDIFYQPLLSDHKLHAGYKNEIVDTDFIKQFETTYGPPHLWHYLYSDRKLMMSIGPKEETTTVIDPLYGHEDLLRIFQARARPIEKMLREERPDFILFFNIGAFAHLLLFHIAKKLGIRTFILDFPRIGNLVSLTEDYNTLTGIGETYLKRQNATVEDEYVAKAREFIARFRRTGSLDLEYLAVDAAIINPSKQNPLLRFESIYRSLSYFAALTKNYWRNRGIFLYGETDMNPLRFLGHKIKRRWRALHPPMNLYTLPQAHEEFAFFPLHYEPELAILLLSPFYFDQIMLIRSIARALPLHMKLYVKEHPSMPTRRARSYYRELLKIPNVRLVPHTIKSTELLNAPGCKLVTAITGTVGWEACLLQKPVITFGEVFYNALPLVRRARSLDDLPALIREQMEKPKINESELLNFVAAAFADGFPFNYAGLWYENSVEKLMQDAGIVELCRRLMAKLRETRVMKTQ